MRYLYLETNPCFDLDEDGLPCHPAPYSEDSEVAEVAEVETPHDPVCPVLYQWVMEAKSAGEVVEVFKAHDSECPRCGGAIRRAA
jgi:hypothetical protein